eukprot:890586_1
MSDQGVTAEDLKPTEDTEEKPTKDLEYTELKLDDDDDELGLIDNVDIEDIPLVDELRSHVDELKTADLLDYIDRYQQKIEVYRAQKVKLKQSKRENVKKHRGSVIDLHNRMFKKLIDTESEQKTELEHTKDRVLELETEVKKFKFTEQDAEAVAKGDGNSFKTGQIETLLDENAKLEKKARDLETKLKSSVIELEKMKREKTHDEQRKSISTLHTNMFTKLLDAEDDFKDKMDKVNAKLVRTQRALKLEKMRTVQSDHLRRDSIQTVHNNMLTKLLDAEAEHDMKEERHQKEVNALKAALRKEILRNAARAEKDAADREDVDSDMSDLETEKETRHTPKHKERFDDLWNEADEPAAEVERLKRQIVGLEKQLKEANVENEEIERTRKDSIHNLHNNMFQKLLDAEFEYEEEIERLHREKEEFNKKIEFYEDALKKMNSGDGATEIIQLREEIQQKNEEIEALQVKVENEQKQMQIIPHDYLDNLLEEACAKHTRKESLMNHLQAQLEKHLPQPVAAQLAETLVISVQNNAYDKMEITEEDTKDDNRRSSQLLLSETAVAEDGGAKPADKTLNSLVSMVNQLQIENQVLKAEKESLQSRMDEQCDASKEQQNSLQSVVNKLQNEVKILQVEKEGLQSLTDELLQKQSEMAKDIAQSKSMRSMIKELQNEVEILRTEKDNSIETCNQLRNENNALNEECKESKMELVNLKSKYDELKQKCPLDITQYKEWSGEDVIMWIVSLENGRFKKYEETLKVSFKEQEFVGQWLDDVQKSDVHDWGIKHFGDKTKLFQYIDEITNNTLKSSPCFLYVTHM